mmetsp:Transcript_65576/g.80293  ORF Transcript_65576/g.80293 Transcript_65576/m.80293 type:complete len:80 (-) Transcript_65576:43-282(-)
MSNNDDDQYRQEWTQGSHVQIYSNSRQKWFLGEIATIFHDDDGEWLEVRYHTGKYNLMSKCVQRYSTEIKRQIKPYIIR